MKFISWNVNGIRACVTKGFCDVLKNSEADVFALQETKCQPEQVPAQLQEVEGYSSHWYSAQRKGYSGTAIFVKEEPLNVTFGLGKPEFDDEGRLITAEYEKFYFVTCYTPNAKEGLARIEYRCKWEDEVRDYLCKLDKEKPVIYCGDLNVAHQEIDLKNPSSNRGNAGFSDEEREKFSALLNSGFTDTFRHLYPHTTGAYSWWSYRFNARKNNAGWRIDYFLVSDRIASKITGAKIHSDVFGSDHCPVELNLEI